MGTNCSQYRDSIGTPALTDLRMRSLESRVLNDDGEQSLVIRPNATVACLARSSRRWKTSVSADVRGVERFWSKVDKAGECWVWTAATDSNGYGRFSLNGKTALAHRVAWALTRGPIPAGKELDHLCRVPGCVNPNHLEPVTHKENCRRGVLGQAGGVYNRSKTQCPSGHPYDEGNTYRTSSGWRLCRACGRERQNKVRAERRGKTDLARH